MEDEAFDIYGDLDEALIEPLQEEVNNKKAIEEAREKELKNIKDKNETILLKLNKDNQQLRTNMHMLLATCSSEIKRKDELIASMRKERDDLIFRKTKQFNKKTSEKYTQTYPSSCSQSKFTQTSAEDRSDRNTRKSTYSPDKRLIKRDKSRQDRRRRSPEKYDRDRRSFKERDDKRLKTKSPERNIFKIERDQESIRNSKSSEEKRKFDKTKEGSHDLRNKIREKQSEHKTIAKNERFIDKSEKHSNIEFEKKGEESKVEMPGIVCEEKQVIHNTRAQSSKRKSDTEVLQTKSAIDEALSNFEKSNQEHFTNGINEEVIKNQEVLETVMLENDPETPSQTLSTVVLELPIDENVEDVLFDSRNLSNENVKSCENESFDSTKENCTNNSTLNTSAKKRKIVTTEVDNDGTVIFTIIRKKKKRKVQ